MGKLTEAFGYINDDPAYGTSYHPAFLTIREEAKRLKKEYRKNLINTEGELEFSELNNQITSTTMEQKTGIVQFADNLPMIQEAFSNLDAMEQFCQRILASKLAPDHFYPKIPGTNDRDYANGNTAAVMMVLIQGAQLKLPALTSLQQIVPVNGLLSIKGDGAKSLILNSGKVEPGTWIEKEEGSIDAGTYVVTISAQRSDTKERLSRSFSIAQAKKAGLWITDEMLKAQDAWKHKKSAWYKYPERMIKYRALGFLARDLFPDVMAGCYTEEEARDIPVDTTTNIDTPSGQQIIIPDKQFNQERSQNLTSKAAQTIDKMNGGKKPGVQDAVITSGMGAESPREVILTDQFGNEGIMANMNQRTVDNRDLAPGQPQQELQQTEKTYTEEELKEIKAEVLQEMCESIPITKEAMNIFSGKNTNKKLREIILAYQDGSLTDMVMKYKATMAPITNQQEEAQPPETPEEQDFPPMEPVDTGDQEEYPQQDIGAGGMPVNTGFYDQVDINIPELPEEGPREFSVAARLYGALNTLRPAVTDQRYLEIASHMPGLAARFRDKEEFCKKANPDLIREVIVHNAKI